MRSTSRHRNGSMIRSSISPIMCIELRCRSPAMMQRYSGSSPISWSDASIEIDRCGKAGRSKDCPRKSLGGPD